MNEIIIHNCELPEVLSGAYEVASTPFVHANRLVDFDVMIYVTHGYICVTEDEHDYMIHQNELFFLKKGLHHYGKQEIPQGTSWFYVHFRSPEVSEQHNSTLFQIQNEPSNQGFVMKENRHFLTLPKFTYVDSNSQLSKMIAQFIDYLNSTEPLRRWNIHRRLQELLTECALTCAQNSSPISLSDKIANYLVKHISEPFKAEMLETQFHLSYKHMASIFKRETGFTMQTYHTLAKMNLACKLLRSTLLPVKDISLQLGYQDMLYFSRVFHLHIGCSPSAYRKRDRI